MRLLIANLLIVIAVSSVNTIAAWGQEFLYLPQPVVKGDDDPLRKDGLLVREVLVKKRDTLSGISKRFSGKGIYYPQILLFNSIRNPHLIHPGDLLRVPVSSKAVLRSRITVLLFQYRSQQLKEMLSPRLPESLRRLTGNLFPLRIPVLIPLML